MTSLLSTSDFRAFNRLLDLAGLILRICNFFILGVIRGTLHASTLFSSLASKVKTQARQNT